MQWFPLQVLVLTFVCFHGALRTAATVVTNFTDVDHCADDFYKSTPPAGIIDPKLTKICQTIDGEARFVTVYNKKLRIPILSAYKFEKPGGEPDEVLPAMHEPQLVDIERSRNMEQIPVDLTAEEVEKIERSQAVPEDYSSSAEHKILHLSPVSHQAGLANRKAVFALTNAVPLLSTITSWKKYEIETRDLLDQYCLGTTYVITGVTVSTDYIRRKDEDRVAIPDTLWSAYCCDKINPEAPEEILQRLPARAALVKNAKEALVEKKTVKDLEEFLTLKLATNRPVQMFDNNCVLSS